VRVYQRKRALGEGRSVLRFLVGENLVTTGQSVATDRVKLVVDDVDEVAARCWDAGFEVHVRGTADASTIVVIDPSGLEVELISSGSHAHRGAVAAASTIR
jgi:hypothetical protein